MAKSQTKIAPKPTWAEPLTRSSLFWLSVLLFVAFPFINNFFLQTVILNITGNIAYENLVPVLSTALSLLSVLTSYAGIGVIATSIANFGTKNSIGTVILGILSHPIGVIAYIISYAISGARNYEYAVFTLGVDAAATMLIYALIIVILSVIKKKRTAAGTSDAVELRDKLIDKGGAYTYVVTSTAIFGAAQVLSTLATMITDFLNPSIGTPINIQEWVYWITKYLTEFIYLGIGYFIVLGIFYLTKYYRTHFAEQNQ